MQHGFLKVAAVVPKIRVADCAHNVGAILDALGAAMGRGCELAVFPELCVTGATCGDLFLQRALLNAAADGLLALAEKTREYGMLIVVGLPYAAEGRLYSCSAFLLRGMVTGIVPSLNPFGAQFSPGSCVREAYTSLNGLEVPFGMDLVWRHVYDPDCTVTHISSCPEATGGVVVCPAADIESAGRPSARRRMAAAYSAGAVCGYIRSNAGWGESTTDHVYSGHSLVMENGRTLAEIEPFGGEDGEIALMAVADIDIGLLAAERMRGAANHGQGGASCRVIPFGDGSAAPLTRRISRTPFFPCDEAGLVTHCVETLDIQAAALAGRMAHIGCGGVVLGLSGGLDSALALIVAIRAFKRMGLDCADICAVTMPCFGTSQRTLSNARALAEMTGAMLMEIQIDDAVLQHFHDIGHSRRDHGLVYENAQARERTQVLMDLAAKRNTFMIGSGDLSEIALGFATYGGDHMSMYNVNAGVPKTLIPHLLETVAGKSPAGLAGVLRDIIDTPISPELLPGSQPTEAIIGPYELHDFFIYYMVGYGFAPEKILFLAENAFGGVYSQLEIKRWLAVFYRRFFANQYKRSCMPDGPMVCGVSLSPRHGVWQMPSDAAVGAWLARIDLES